MATHTTLDASLLRLGVRLYCLRFRALSTAHIFDWLRGIRRFQ